MIKKRRDYVAVSSSGQVFATHRVVERDQEITHLVIGTEVFRENGEPLTFALDWCRGEQDSQYHFKKRREQKSFDTIADPTARGDYRGRYKGYRLINGKTCWHDVELLEVMPPPEGYTVRDGKVVPLCPGCGKRATDGDLCLRCATAGEPIVT